MSSVATQLGFCVAISNKDQWLQTSHHAAKWDDWDGGQAGGVPSWLQPEHLPLPIHCGECQKQMNFLCQLYAPIDPENIGNYNETAFHRSLYVFACPNYHENTGVRVLRTQLPKRNSYWPEQPIFDWTLHTPDKYHKNGVCAVCGFVATGRCPLQKKSFCGKDHQKLYRKHGNEELPPWKSLLPGVLRTTEIVVEEEPEPEQIIELSNRPRKNPLFETSNDEDDSDAELEQEDLNAMVTGLKTESKTVVDPLYEVFLNRITERPDCKNQVLRYCRWPTNDSDVDDKSNPLWIRTDHQPTSIPRCSDCGSERKFEFQLMPQLLHYLVNDVKKAPASTEKDAIRNALEQADSIVEQAPPEQIPPSFVDAKQAAVERVRKQIMENSELDWGVIAVYTCSQSCAISNIDQDLGAYKEEFAWRQPSIDSS
jgi:pre-rRNA-processing protein TSR4